MAETFTVSAGLGKFQAILGKLRPETRAMVAQGLNDLAFAFRAEAPKVMATKRTIRDARFIASRFYVEKAKPNAPLSSMFARSGSIKSERFSGWSEDYGEGQEKGRASRAIGSIGRGGSMEAKAQTKSRLRPGQNYPKPDQFSGKTWNAKVAMMISMVARGKVDGSAGMIIYGGKWRPGLYRLDAKAAKFIKSANRKKSRGALANSVLRYPPVQRVQTFGVEKKSMRFDWAHLTQTKVLTHADAIWSNAFKRNVTP